jgi:5-formyltetrahydrofolate cyclo-ligase
MPTAEPSWPEIRAWRRQQRERLIAARVALPAPVLRAHSAAINAHLRAGFDLPAAAVVGFCWPFRNEFDLRFAVRDFRARGAVAALPVVIDKSSPLQFRRWWPGAPMARGVYDIPYPEGTELLVPDIAFVPVNGFDAQGYRLGYGGGYFDRTLAALSPRPVAIGIGFELARLPTIHPQAHDIAMDLVVTENGVQAPGGAGLQTLTAAACGARLRQLLEQRGLPRRQHAAPAGYHSPACQAAEFPGYFGADGPATD